MKKYRPKTQIMYSYGTLYTALIWCHPQSRWTLLHDTGSIVHLTNKSVSIDISKDEFKRNWVEAKGDKRGT